MSNAPLLQLFQWGKSQPPIQFAVASSVVLGGAQIASQTFLPLVLKNLHATRQTLITLTIQSVLNELSDLAWSYSEAKMEVLIHQRLRGVPLNLLQGESLQKSANVGTFFRILVKCALTAAAVFQALGSVLGLTGFLLAVICASLLNRVQESATRDNINDRGAMRAF